jgi:hypothetical protein
MKPNANRKQGTSQGRNAMRRVSLAMVAALGFASASCTADWAKQNNSTILFEIARIQGLSASNRSGDTLYSDVSDGIADDATVTVNIFQKNPNITASSPNQHVQLESYSVKYFRTDGRNTEGVDVPYSFSGPAAARLHTPGQGNEVSQDIDITVVRPQAKIEPPLRNMVGTTIPLPAPPAQATLQGAGILTVIAEITVYGSVLSGERLSATGRLQVTFADFQ